MYLSSDTRRGPPTAPGLSHERRSWPPPRVRSAGPGGLLRLAGVGLFGSMTSPPAGSHRSLANLKHRIAHRDCHDVRKLFHLGRRQWLVVEEATDIRLVGLMELP